MVNTVKSFLIVLKSLALIVLKTVLKRAIQKTVEATGNLIINNIAEKVNWMRHKNYTRNTSSESETPIETEISDDIPREVCIPPKKKQKDYW